MACKRSLLNGWLINGIDDWLRDWMNEWVNLDDEIYGVFMCGRNRDLVM